MEENKVCPCCGRHCSLEDPMCERGRRYAEKMNRGEAPVHNKPHSTNDKLIRNLRDLGHMMKFSFEGKGSQKRILIILYESGDMTQRELTERIGIKPGSASEVIGKLENAGLIERRASREDRRTADIKLTEEGRAQAKEAFEQRKVRHEEMFGCLSEEEKNTLLALLEKLRDDWNERFRGREEHFHGHGKHCGMREDGGHHGKHGGRGGHRHPFGE